jgi:amidase
MKKGLCLCAIAALAVFALRVSAQGQEEDGDFDEEYELTYAHTAPQGQHIEFAAISPEPVKFKRFKMQSVWKMLADGDKRKKRSKKSKKSKNEDENDDVIVESLASKLANDDESFYFASAIELAYEIRQGRLSAEQVARAYFERISSVNATQNSVTELRSFESILAEAVGLDEGFASSGGRVKGPLHGVPCCIKDHIAVDGLLQTFGTAALAEHRAESDASVVRRLRDAGAIVMCKTNVPEMALSFDTANTLFGRTRNAHRGERSSGGSSGGCAALVAGGGVPFSIGSDVGGSLRVPVHLNGAGVSVKSTQGRVPLTGAQPAAFGELWQDSAHLERMFTLGPIARHAEDAELVLSLISGSDGTDPQAAGVPVYAAHSHKVRLGELRVGYYVADDDSADVKAAVEAAAMALGDHVHSMARTEPPNVRESVALLTRVVCADGGDSLRHIVELGQRDASPQLAVLVDQVCPSLRIDSLADVRQLALELNTYRSSMLAWMRAFDVVIAPVTKTPAPMPDIAFDLEQFPAAYYHTIAYNVGALPVTVVSPILMADADADYAQLPVGVSIITSPLAESASLAVARFLQFKFPPVWPQQQQQQEQAQ